MTSGTLESRSNRVTLATVALLLLTIVACSDDGSAAMNAFDSGEYEKAMDLWMPLADKGNAEAQFGVAFLYDEGLGVPKDGVEAIRWYRLAAEQGHETSQLNLGALYQSGREDVTSDPGRAADWYRMAADQGNAKAQYYLGRLYYRGQGLPRSHELAFEWFQKSADQDYLPAVNHLGMLYNRGMGVEQDAERGFEMILRAAELGEPAAQINLTATYVRGIGVEQDFIEAFKWLTIYESHELGATGLPMDWVNDQMSAEDVEEAKRRAAEWIAAHPAPEEQ